MQHNNDTIKPCILCREKTVKNHPTDCMKNRLCEECLKREGVQLAYKAALAGSTEDTAYYPSNQEIREYEWLVKTGRL